ncbi:MAG: nitrogen regulation protein NR(II) [Hyphomicrobiaceae bacterium]
MTTTRRNASGPRSRAAEAAQGPRDPVVPGAAASGPAAPAPSRPDQIVSALPYPICLIGEGNRFVFANPAAEDFFGASLAYLRRHVLEFFVPADCPLASLVSHVRRSGASMNEYEVEVSLPRLDQVRLVDVFAGPLPDDRSLIHVMLLGRTMAQMIERQMTHRAAARSVSGLAAMLAHEIKNPLSGIRGAAQLLEPSLSDGDRVLARLICAETDRIRDLVDRMEVFGDERPLTKQPVNIHDVLAHVKAIAENGFAASVGFIESYDPSLPPVSGIRDKLIQALLNLVKNAAEALDGVPEPRRIVLRTRFRPGVRLSVPGAGSRVQLPLVIEIEDNGPGIPDSVRSGLFDPFVTTKHSGTGLGLALVAKIIGDHGGVIEFDSEPRRTVFRVLLPLHGS